MQDNNTVGDQVSVRLFGTHKNDAEFRNVEIENGEKRRNPASKYKKYNHEKREIVIYIGWFVLFLLAIGVTVASFTVPSWRKATPRGLATWQWCLLITALIGGPLLSKAVIKFIMIFIDRQFSAKENLIYYMVAIVDDCWVILWFSMILVAWLWVVQQPRYLHAPKQNEGVLNRKFASTVHVITISLITVILGSLFWLVKDLVLKITKSSFHIRRFFGRVKESLLHQYMIQTLSEVSQCRAVDCVDQDPNGVRTVFTKYKKQAFLQINRGICSKRNKKIVIDPSIFDELSEKTVSCWGMKHIIQGIMKCPLLTYVYKDIQEGECKVAEIDSEDEAIVAADAIYSSFVHSESPQDDILKHFPERKRTEVTKCLLKGADSKQITKEVLKKWMVKAYKYREGLVGALEANKRLFDKLNRIVNVILVFLIFVLWLIMIRAESRRVIFVLGSAAVGAAFIFGDTCKKLFENLVFVFVQHPFDVGDCCLIDNTPVIIHEVNIFSTVAYTFAKERRQYPNGHLTTQTISNYTISPDMGDFVEFFLEVSTEIEKIQHLKDAIKSYIKENCQYWHPEHYWVVDYVQAEGKSLMKMSLHFKHTINFHEFIERQTRRTLLALEIKRFIHSHSE